MKLKAILQEKLDLILSYYVTSYKTDNLYDFKILKYISKNIEKLEKQEAPIPELKTVPSNALEVINETVDTSAVLYKYETYKSFNYPFIKLDEEEIARRKLILSSIKNKVESCKSCKLYTGRKNVVVGEGVVNPIVLVIGEGPGVEEDASGRPFVGPSGKFLDKWLSSISLNREENVYILNVIKCHPPMNRPPQDAEMVACSPYIEEQIKVLKPLAILSLGNVATSFLLAQKVFITKKRGTLTMYKNNIPLLPTFHPSAVLRDMRLKELVWQDLKVLREFLKEFAYNFPIKPESN